MLTVILNLRTLTTSIAFHDVIHRLRVGQGTGIAYPKAKLIQKLTTMMEEVLYAIFLNLHNVYVTLDRDICLEILEGYGVGPQALCILH